MVGHVAPLCATVALVDYDVLTLRSPDGIFDACGGAAARARTRRTCATSASPPYNEGLRPPTGRRGEEAWNVLLVCAAGKSSLVDLPSKLEL